MCKAQFAEMYRAQTVNTIPDIKDQQANAKKKEKKEIK